MSKYRITRLVSNLPGVAAHQDATLINAWGLFVDEEGIWVAVNETGLVKLYSKKGVLQEEVKVLVDNEPDNPTGLVKNESKGFVIAQDEKAASAEWITVTEGGRIFAYNDLVSEDAVLVLDESDESAVYKGIAQAGDRIYVADFHNFSVDTYDANWVELDLGPNAFMDPNLPLTPLGAYSPFNVAVIHDKVYVAFAVKPPDEDDEVSGPGLGIVSVFDLDGVFLKRLITGGALNAPWAMVEAPECFGCFSEKLLVGNFGDGKINVYSFKGKHLGELEGKHHKDLVVDGLWGLFSSKKKVYYAAGPDDESNGEVGYISVKEEKWDF